jgi:hypothetical protein
MLYGWIDKKDHMLLILQKIKMIKVILNMIQEVMLHKLEVDYIYMLRITV